MDDHDGQRFDYLLEELDGARSSSYNIMAIAVAVAGFIVVGLQFNSLAITLYPAVAALLLLVLSNAFRSRQERIAKLLKQYLEQPEKSDLQSMLKEVWERTSLRSLLGLAKKG